jgi:signal transduction histidine kinase
VLVLRAPLEDTLSNVELVRRRLLLAGAVALLLSLALGTAPPTLRPAAAATRACGRPDRERPVRRADRRPRRRRGRPARGGVRPDAPAPAALERARREFIANASHELRTPIFSLGGFLELLDDEDLDEATRKEFLAPHREQVTRLTKLATDLLDLSRSTPGRVQLEREKLDLGALARTICREFEPWPARSGIELETVLTGRGRRRRRAANDPDRPDPGRERPAAHASGTTVRIGRPRERPGRARGRRRGPGIAATQHARSSTASTGWTAGSRPAAGWGSRSRKSSPS